MAEGFCRWVDAINEWAGKFIAWLFLPFTLLIVVDVFTRYVLNKPWPYYDIEIQLMGIVTALGFGYCLLHNGHVGVDILVMRLSQRNRAILNMALFLFFLGAIGPLLWSVLRTAWTSIGIQESFTGILGLPIYPFKTITAVAVLFLLLEGIAKFIGNLRVVFPTKSGGKP